MNARELIESGIIEAYCLGIASEEEIELVKYFALINDAVRDELEAVTSALAKYDKAHSVTPSERVKKRILDEIEDALSLAPLLTPQSTVQEWLDYLKRMKAFEPEHYEGIHVIELPSDNKRYTFAAWAHQGDSHPDEVHEVETEYLFICGGECEMTVDGKKTKYKRGDLITINKGEVHSAVVTGEEKMLMIVQRRAA